MSTSDIVRGKAGSAAITSYGLSHGEGAELSSPSRIFVARTLLLETRAQGTAVQRAYNHPN